MVCFFERPYDRSEADPTPVRDARPGQSRIDRGQASQPDAGCRAQGTVSAAAAYMFENVEVTA